MAWWQKLAPVEELRFVRVGLKAHHPNDLYSRLLRSSWPRLVVLIATVFIAINLAFATLYMLEGGNIENARPNSFADFFFFSVQTMATIGYGKMAPATILANVLVTMEAFVGLLGLALVTGLVFAKFSLPTARVLFSRHAVIGPRDGARCLMFRMANGRRDSQIVEAQIHVAMSKIVQTMEGESMRRMFDLTVLRARSPIFGASWIAVHPINETSPLFAETEASLGDQHAAITVSLIGIDGTTSQTVYARHTYLADQIVWNACMADIFTPMPDGTMILDYTRFHDVIRLNFTDNSQPDQETASDLSESK